MTIVQRVEAILEEAMGCDLSSWEKFEFLPNIKERAALTTKQEEILSGIEKRLGLGGSHGK